MTPSRIEPVRLIGLLMGFGGVAALVGLDLEPARRRAVVELAVVVVGYAIGPMIQARWLADLPSYSVVAASLLIVGVGLPAGRDRLSTRSHVEAGPLASIVVLGTVCTAVGVRRLLRADRRGRAGPGGRVHLRQSGRGRAARASSGSTRGSPPAWPSASR